MATIAAPPSPTTAPVAAADVETPVPTRSSHRPAGHYHGLSRRRPPLSCRICAAAVVLPIREVESEAAMAMPRLSSADFDKGSKVSVSSLWTDGDERSQLVGGDGSGGDSMTHPGEPLPLRLPWQANPSRAGAVAGEPLPRGARLHPPAVPIPPARSGTSPDRALSTERGERRVESGGGRVEMALTCGPSHNFSIFSMTRLPRQQNHCQKPGSCFVLVLTLGEVIYPFFWLRDVIHAAQEMREVKWTYLRCGGALCPAIVQAHMAAVEREAAHLARYWLILGLWGWIACAGLRMHNLCCGLGSHRAFAPFVAAGGGRCCKGGAGEEGGGGGEARRRIPPKAPSSDASLSDGGGSEGSDSGAAPIESPSKRPRRSEEAKPQVDAKPGLMKTANAGGWLNMGIPVAHLMNGNFVTIISAASHKKQWKGVIRIAVGRFFFFPSKEFAAVGLCIEGVGSRKSKILSISKMEKRRQTGHKVKLSSKREKGTRCTPHLTLKGNASTQLFFLGLASPRLCPSPLPLDSSTSAPNLPFRVRASIPPCSHHPIWGPV
uniref:Uncharacterized protein n=1 Tax=Oryza rufipogon TaxID=4529 RepID=A0A0E0PMZ8_ORYRU